MLKDDLARSLARRLRRKSSGKGFAARVRGWLVAEFARRESQIGERESELWRRLNTALSLLRQWI
jgi:hypothetical protein